MKKHTFALGLLLGGLAFGCSGLVVSALAEEHPGGGKEKAEGKEKVKCPVCEKEVNKLVCEDCGKALKEVDGKMHCEHCKADKKGECKHCWKVKHPEEKGKEKEKEEGK